MAVSERERTEIVFEIKEHIGTIAKLASGWSRELNMVSWNEKAPKFDIRDWDPEHRHMSRGITLHKDEMQKVVDMLREREF